MRFIRIFLIRRTYNESSKLTLEYIHQNPIKSRKFLLLYSHKNNKIKKSNIFQKTWLPIHSNVKLEMCPVNALRLEWCYDTGNDKNITIIRLSMQLV